MRKTSNSKLQTPRKLQIPNSNLGTRWKVRAITVLVCLLSPTLSSKGGEGAGLSEHPEQERMTRMVRNLVKPELKVQEEKARRVRAEWREHFEKEPDPQARMEIVTEVAQLDDAETIHMLLQWLRQEKDSGVRQQIVLMLGYMRSTEKQLAESPAI